MAEARKKRLESDNYNRTKEGKGKSLKRNSETAANLSIEPGQSSGNSSSSSGQTRGTFSEGTTAQLNELSAVAFYVFLIP